MRAKKVVIDGRCIRSGQIKGDQRYATEILKELDKLVSAGKYELLIRPEYKDEISLQNIQKVEVNAQSKMLWRLKTFLYLVKENALYIHLTNGITLWKKSIVTLHDIYAFYGVCNNSWEYYLKCKSKAIIDALVAEHIVTVSEFSRQTMLDKLPLKPEKISVIYNGWQHLKDIEPDESILKKINRSPQSYYFFLGRLVNNKNIKWIFQVADNHPDDCFVISGRLDNEKFDYYKGENIIYTGFVSEGEMKALYQNCKAFLFPSFMEGFGIPPMEALYNGAPIIISNTSSLPEIYGNSAHYIDPMRYDYCLEDLLKEPVGSSDDILNKYSWKKSARQWYELIEDYLNKGH